MASLNLAQKIISDHLVEGKVEPGQEIGLKVDRVYARCNWHHGMPPV